MRRLVRTKHSRDVLPGTVIVARMICKNPKHEGQASMDFETSFSSLLSFGGLVVRVPGYRSRDPGFNSRHYQIIWEVVGLERGPLSPVSTTEELLGRNSSCPGQEKLRIDCADHVALTSPASGGRPVDVVHSRTKDTEFSRVFSFSGMSHKSAMSCGNAVCYKRNVTFHINAQEWTAVLVRPRLIFRKYPVSICDISFPGWSLHFHLSPSPAPGKVQKST
jgi:hypothetical protein